MNRKDILELKKRFKKDDCTFTKMCGCYVNGDKNIVLKLSETFLTLKEVELHKYLEIAKKTLSGTIGNNLLELEFPNEEEMPGGRQHSLMALKRSCLKDENLLDKFYQMVIDSYEYTGNYLILLFHDAYDVITKTEDNLKLDESEEVYEYILCAICPVTLSKPGLSFFEDENRIGVRIRDWVVGMPENGFVFPAFSDRSSDIHSIMYYTKNAKEPHAEFMENGLGCTAKQTAAEQQEVFHSIVRNAVGEDEEKSDKAIMDIQENLNNMIEENKAMYGKKAEPIVLTSDVVSDVLAQSGISDEVSKQIEESYKEEFQGALPDAETMVDTKAVNANAKKKKEEILEKQVRVLTEELERTKEQLSDEQGDIHHEAALENDSPSIERADGKSDDDAASDNLHEDISDGIEHNDINSTGEANDYDIIVNVNPKKIPEIKYEIINGKRCLIIPFDENEQAKVNGVDAIV